MPEEKGQTTKPAGSDAVKDVRAHLLPGDLDYTTDAAAVVLEQTPRGAQVLLWSIVALVVGFLVWAGFAEIEEVTKGDGKVIPSSKIQTVQNLEGGILAELMVREGQVVEKDQVLLRIDKTRFFSSLSEQRKEYYSTLAKSHRLRAEAEGREELELPDEIQRDEPNLAMAEVALFESRKRELRNKIQIKEDQIRQKEQEIKELESKRGQLAESLSFARKELRLTEPLIKSGAVSEVELLRLRRTISELSGDLRTTELSIPRAESRLQEARRALQETEFEFRNSARLEYSEQMTKLSQLKEASVALEDKVRRTEVRSPVRGTVNQVMINTRGGVIQPGQDLLEIVPLEDTLLIEAKISPKDIAFIRPDHQAMVKFTAYDYAIYGGLKARVEHISADSLVDEQGNSAYLIRVRTDKNFLGEKSHPLPIIPGMIVEVDVLTGKKTILDYLLKPVLKAKSNALTER